MDCVECKKEVEEIGSMSADYKRVKCLECFKAEKDRERAKRPKISVVERSGGVGKVEQIITGDGKIWERSGDKVRGIGSDKVHSVGDLAEYGKYHNIEVQRVRDMQSKGDKKFKNMMFQRAEMEGKI